MIKVMTVRASKSAYVGPKREAMVTATEQEFRRHRSAQHEMYYSLYT